MATAAMIAMRSSSEDSCVWVAVGGGCLLESNRLFFFFIIFMAITLGGASSDTGCSSLSSRGSCVRGETGMTVAIAVAVACRGCCFAENNTLLEGKGVSEAIVFPLKAVAANNAQEQQEQHA